MVVAEMISASASAFCNRGLSIKRCMKLLIPQRSYHWVYKDNEDGYHEKSVEERFRELSPGGRIKHELKGDVSVVTIDNPSKKNAFTGEMLVDFRSVVKKLWDSENMKAVIICGQGNSFCSGLDLNLAAQLTEPTDGESMCRYMQNTLTLFQLLPSITVAAIKGPAIGGGSEVITAADFRIVFPDSVIQFVHKKMGIIPGWGGVTRLRQIVGPRKAMHLLASSEPLDPKSALLIGLADALASDPDESSSVVATTMTWLERTYTLSETDASVFTAMKRAAYDSAFLPGSSLPLDFKLRREKGVLATVWGKAPNKNAVNRLQTLNK